MADTAHLIVALKLDDSGFASKLARANTQVGGFGGTASRASRQIGLLGHTLSTAVGVGLSQAVSSGIGLLRSSITEGIDGARTLELAQAATQAAIISTGGAAGITAQQIRDMSEAFENQNALIDDKVIQSGANVLLTFRHIRKDAFEPALLAALDLSTALGTDLQSSVLQVGKALEDPVRGVTALRRAGIQLSPQQEKQIKALIKQNDLYGAQTIILEELSKQVGGRFAAAGRTGAGGAAAFRDSIEDLQISFAQGLLPGISIVQTRVSELFRDPGMMGRVKEFGEKIGSFLTAENVDKAAEGIGSFFNELKTVPWGTIADGLRITGSAAKVAIDAFMSLPKEAQSIVLGALAANKLSGGIAGSLAGSLIKGGLGLAVRSMNVAAGNVTVVGGTVPGGGAVPVPTGGWRAFLTGAMKVIPIVGLEILLGEVASQFTRELNPSQFDFNQVAGQSGNFNTQQQAEAFALATATRLGVPLDELKAGIVTGVTGGMTFDQAVAAFIAAVKPKVTPGPTPDRVHPGGAPGRGTPHGVHPGGAPGGGRPLAVKLPDTAMTALTNTPTQIARLAPILSRHDQSLQTLQRRMGEQKMATSLGLAAVRGAIEAKDMSAQVTAHLTVNTFISGTMFAKQQSVVHVAAGRYAGKPVPLS